MILKLGSGKAATRSCGPKATLLDRAARAGLPVPPGVIVLDEAWRSALERGLVKLEAVGARRPISVPDPSLLVHLIGLPPFNGPLAIRAAFSSKQGGGETVKGDLVPGLFVEGRRPAALAAGLAGVWASAYGRPRGFRRDLIAHEMVRARTEGVAYLQDGYEDDVVEAAEGTLQRLAARPVARDHRLLPRLERSEKPTEDHPVDARLQILLRDVRRAFGDADWKIEWADDGQRVWLVQVGALDVVPLRNEAFTVATHRALLPDLPSPLMASLAGFCAAGLIQNYRRFDPGLPTVRPVLEVLEGRPVLNLTLLTDMMRRWGLPTRLVTGSIGGAADREFGARLGRMIRHAPVLARLLRAQLRAVRSAQEAEQTILERTATPPAGLTDALDELCWLYGVLAREMLLLTGALCPALALLRRAGVLPEVSRRWRLTATEMLVGLDALVGRVAERSEALVALRQGRLPEAPDVREAIEDWLRRFGHRGVYESDISRPRYREAPQILLRSLALPPTTPTPPLPLSSWSRLLRPVAWQAERLLRGRESLRSAAMVGFERLRRTLLDRAAELVGEGVLPRVDALFDLEVEEARRLGDAFRPDAAFWTARREAVETRRSIRIPDVVHRQDDLSQAPEPPSAERSSRLEGLGLTSGAVEGKAWVAEEPSATLPAGLEPSSTVLVARAVDLGWLVSFRRVAGVAVETGGDLSYGSTALGELGLPAVTNVRGLTREVRTGDRIFLRADDGVVEIVRRDG